ncbi:MAG: DUF1080 domain-containing protein [Cyclobacteriaceae bacterium]
MKNNTIKFTDRKSVYGNIFLLILIFLATTVQGQNKKNKSVEKKQIILFDGKSTDQWKDIKSDAFPKQGWVIKDGILTVLAKTDNREGGHDIVTINVFSNFELELEVRLSEGANSGIKYMVVDSYPGKEGNYLGLEYQLIDNEKHPDAELGRNGNRKMAALYDILPIRKKVRAKPAGQWNKVKIVVNRRRVEHWLNDEKALEYIRNSDSYKELVKLSKYNKLKNFGGQKEGRILLQGHGNEVSFRNITISTWE